MNATSFLARLRRAPERDAVILVGDSSGFTRRTNERGIVEALEVVVRGYARVVPILRRRGGRVISRKADNLLAVFPDAEAALRSAAEIQRDLRRMRSLFSLCLGIAAGPVRRVAGDLWGAAVNVASKIGEDLAAAGEILVTDEVARRVKGRIRCVYARSTVLGGRPLELYRVPVPR